MSTWSRFRRIFASPETPPTKGKAAVLERLEERQESPQPLPRARVPKSNAIELTPESLERDVTLALEALRAELHAEHQTPDLTVLLDTLSGNLSGQLRQLPSAAQQALAACDDPNVPTQALVPLFERDPILAKALLERANSAYYNPAGTPCLSLGPAIVRQGRRSAHNVILQQVMSGLVCRPGRMWDTMVTRIWSHMVRTGPIARAVAPAFGVDSEQAFALGLLHDVGKLVIFDSLAAQRTAKHSELTISPVAMKRMLRLLHEPLGGLCALRWDLGANAARAIASHHREPPPEGQDSLSEVVWLAERVDLGDQRRLPVDLDELWRQGSLTADLKETEALLAGYRGDEVGTH